MTKPPPEHAQCAASTMLGNLPGVLLPLSGLIVAVFGNPPRCQRKGSGMMINLSAAGVETESAATVARARDRFSAILSQSILFLDKTVDRQQLLALAAASAVICWDFPDLAWRTWLVVDRDPPRIGLQSAAPSEASLTVTMDSTVLHAAAAGETSLGSAFIKGQLQIRGMNPAVPGEVREAGRSAARRFPLRRAKEAHERAAWTFKVFREADGDASPLTGKSIAILGYGQVGRPLALNLRDGTPARVLVGDCDAAAGATALEDGFPAFSIAQATAQADLALLLVPDEVQPALFRNEVAPHLAEGTALVLASGYNLAFGGLPLPSGVDVLLFAPRMLGKCLRSLYLAGKGFFSYLSVEQDATGNAWPLVLALAKGSGSLRRGALHFTAAEEARLDLFGEQAFGPWVGAAVLSAFQVGLEAGLPAEGLLLEMYLSGEMAQTFQAMADAGFLRSTMLHGYTSAFGGMLRSVSIPRDLMANAMREALAEIQSGCAFAQAAQSEVDDGYPCRSFLEEILSPDNPITQTEDLLWKKVGKT